MPPTSAAAVAARPLVEHVLAAVHVGDGFAGVLRAQPGRGRSTLLRQLREAGLRGEEPVTVLWPPSGRDERPYGLLAALLAELDLDPPAGGRELPELLARAVCDEHASREWVRCAVPWLLRSLRQRSPVLVLVDDAHQEDAESVSLLASVGARTGGTRIGVLLSAPLDATLPAGVGLLPTVQLPELDESDVLALLAERASLVTPTVAGELLTLCGGYPLVLRELLDSVDDEQLRGRAPLPSSPVLGAGARALFRASWADLEPRTRDWLLVLALGSDNVATCVRAGQRLGLELDDLAPAERAGVVRTASTDRVSWRSPLVRLSVAQSATLAERARTYRALAEVSSEHTDPIEHPRWAACSLVGPLVVTPALDRALLAMALDGRLADAYELASQVAGVASEVSTRQRYLVIAAQLCWLAGYPDHAGWLLDRLGAPLSGDVAAAAQVLHWVMRGLRAGWPSGEELHETGALGQRCNGGQRARLMGTAVLAGWETSSADALSGVLAAMRELYHSYPAGRRDIGVALSKVVAGRSALDPGERTALRAVSWWVHQDDPLHPKVWPPPLLPVFLGEESAYARQFAELLAKPHLRAARSTRAMLLLKLAMAQSALGHWTHAIRNADHSRRLAEELGLWALHSDALTNAAWVCAARGQEDRCADLLAASHGQQGRRPAGQHPRLVQWVFGLLELSLARPVEAHTWLLPLHTGPVESPQHLAIRRLCTADFVEASVQAGRPGDAESAVAEFAEWTSGGAAEWALLDFARCRALLDDGQAERWHREAFELAARVGRLATSARVELSYGSWLRRRKRYQEARPHLRVAKDFFHRLAASPWRDRAHAELRAAGETGSTARRVASALTAQELRIAREAAAGRTNREIAASLGLSPRTVGYHLYKIFPKLDITSRTQLPRALSSVDPEAPSRESGLSAH